MNLQKLIFIFALLLAWPVQADVRLGPSGKDDSPPLAAQLTLAKARHECLQLGPGRFVPTDTFFVTGAKDGSVKGYQTACVRGAGMGYSEHNHGTILDCSALKDRPCIAIQSGRAVELSDLMVIGSNRAPLSVVEPVDDPARYLSPGVRTTRYSPQAGIVIDPAVGPVPPDGGYPGFVYGKGLSSSLIKIKNVMVLQNAVGILFSPDGSSANGELVDLDGVVVGFADACLSWGQSQARANTLRGASLGNCRVDLAGALHGKQQGVPPAVYGALVGYSYKIIQFHNAFGTPLYLSGVFAESVKSIGDWGLGPSQYKSPGMIVGSGFTLENRDWTPGPYILQATSPVTLQGVSIGRNIAGDYLFRGRRDRFRFDATGLGKGTANIKFDDSKETWTNIGHWPN